MEAYTTGDELFIYRDPYFLAPQKVLAHELSHVVLHHFIKGTPPLFLNEGFAEFVSYKVLALRAGGDEFAMHTLQKLPEEKYIPLKTLVAMMEYPEDRETFYLESELLVRFLIQRDKGLLLELLRRTAGGEDFKKALNSLYDMDLRELETVFRVFALKGH